MTIWAIKQDQGLNYMDSGIWEYVSFHTTKKSAEKAYEELKKTYCTFWNSDFEEDNEIVEVEVQED